MEQIYRRVKDIDEKIKNTSLPYFDWKVLFLVSDDTPISEINSILDNFEWKDGGFKPKNQQ